MKLSTISEHLLIENTDNGGTIFSLLKSGLERIKKALSDENDIGGLLQYTSPHGHGLNVLKKIYDYAVKGNKDALNDKEWWGSLFKVFGITDQDLQDDVLKQVGIQLETKQVRPEKSAQSKPRGVRSGLRDTINKHAEIDRIKKNFFNIKEAVDRNTILDIIKLVAAAARKQLSRRLSKTGMTPDNITKDLEAWDNIRQRFGGNIQPSDILNQETLAAYSQLENRLNTAMKILQPEL